MEEVLDFGTEKEGNHEGQEDGIKELTSSQIVLRSCQSAMEVSCFEALVNGSEDMGAYIFFGLSFSILFAQA